MKKILSASLLCLGLAHAGEFKLMSQDIKAGDTLSTKFMFNGFGCNGQNLSPELHWENAPQGTKSFAVQVYDPDAPTGSGWWHWTVFNLPAGTKSIAQGQKDFPAGAVQSVTDFGAPGFGGYCPPPGPAHRYYFTVTALDVEQLPLDSKAMPALLGYMINGHKLASAQMMVYGKR